MVFQLMLAEVAGASLGPRHVIKPIRKRLLTFVVVGSGYLYNAVSKGRTELVSLSGEVVLPFFQSSRRFKRVLAKTTAQESAEGELQSVIEKLEPDVLELPVSEVMRTNVATLNPNQPLRKAVESFKTRRFSTCPLFGDDCKLDRIEPMQLPVCSENDTVQQSLERMIRYGRYKCLVCDAENQLLGIITVMDLIGENITGAPPIS